MRFFQIRSSSEVIGLSSATVPDQEPLKLTAKHFRPGTWMGAGKVMYSRCMERTIWPVLSFPLKKLELD